MGGGYKTGRGGGCEVLPIQKGGGGKSLSHAERGHTFFFGSFDAVALSFSHIEGGRKKFPLFKRGVARKVLPCLEWGVQTVLDPRFSHFVSFFPVIND